MIARTLRPWLVAAAIPLLGACGFHPLYGGADNGTGHIFQSIYVEPIASRSGYELRNSLIDLLDSSSNAEKAYRLRVTLNEETKGIALQNDTSITRYNYLLSAHYTLTNAKGRTVTSGIVSTLEAYNVVASPYATLSAQQDAQKRAAEDLSQKIQMDLGVFFARQADRRS